MRTHTRSLSKLILALVGALSICASMTDSAEARQRRHHEARPNVIVDDWGRCWAPRKNGWWLTRCPGRVGAVVEGGVPLQWWWQRSFPGLLG